MNALPPAANFVSLEVREQRKEDLIGVSQPNLHLHTLSHQGNNSLESSRESAHNINNSATKSQLLDTSAKPINAIIIDEHDDSMSMRNKQSSQQAMPIVVHSIEDEEVDANITGRNCGDDTQRQGLINSMVPNYQPTTMVTKNKKKDLDQLEGEKQANADIQDIYEPEPFE